MKYSITLILTLFAFLFAAGACVATVGLIKLAANGAVTAAEPIGAGFLTVAAALCAWMGVHDLTRPHSRHVRNGIRNRVRRAMRGTFADRRRHAMLHHHVYGWILACLAALNTVAMAVTIYVAGTVFSPAVAIGVAVIAVACVWLTCVRFENLIRADREAVDRELARQARYHDAEYQVAARMVTARMREITS